MISPREQNQHKNNKKRLGKHIKQRPSMELLQKRHIFTAPTNDNQNKKKQNKNKTKKKAVIISPKSNDSNNSHNNKKKRKKKVWIKEESWHPSASILRR